MAPNLVALASGRRGHQRFRICPSSYVKARERLAEHNPGAAAQAFSAIACDQAVGDEVRLSAAQQVAEVDPGAAVPACLAIACDEGVGDEVRRSAAEQLAVLDPSA